MASKVKTKVVSNQVATKNDLMDSVKAMMTERGFQVVDCRQTPLTGATKFTLYIRTDKADCKLSFISKPDKKSPYYAGVDEALGQDLCDDEEE